MTTAKVWFASREIFCDSSSYRSNGSIFSKTDAIVAFDGGKYEEVGEIAINDIDDCYSATQNIHSSWNEAKPCRSSCVGDIFQIGDKLHIVASCGYERIR